MKHYVYALATTVAAPPFCSYIKIGHTNNLDARLLSHSIGSPIPLTYAKTWRFSHRRRGIQIESACHREFREKRVHGEWFDIRVEDLIEFVEAYCAKAGVLYSIPECEIPPAYPRCLPPREIANAWSQRTLTA